MQHPDCSDSPAEDNTADPTTVERFLTYHAENPHVYVALVRLARRYRDATGETTQSIKRLVEIARWDMKVRSKGDEDFEINNTYAPYYARLIMAQERDLVDVFEVRRSTEADAWAAGLGEAA